ncbi:MAG: PEP-CTERM sorting domain-containing protein [Rhodanobacter sp.]
MHYQFSVHVSSGLLSGTSENGSFSYDSTSITPGATNKSTGLLTALDFTLNGITYNADTANSGSLSFDAGGNLTDIWFGNSCIAGRCGLVTRGDSWFVHKLLSYTALGSAGFPGPPGAGSVTFSRAAVAVPEPGTLGLFGLGALMIGLFAGVRRLFG